VKRRPEGEWAGLPAPMVYTLGDEEEPSMPGQDADQEKWGDHECGVEGCDRGVRFKGVLYTGCDSYPIPIVLCQYHRDLFDGLPGYEIQRHLRKPHVDEQGAPDHACERVNVGFNSIVWACRHCGRGM